MEVTPEFNITFRRSVCNMEAGFYTGFISELEACSFHIPTIFHAAFVRGDYLKIVL
jgi:hypothetical protein